MQGAYLARCSQEGVGQEDTPKRVSSWSRLWATGAPSPRGPLKSPQNEPQSAPSRAGGCGIHPLTPSPLLKAAPGGTAAWGEGPRQKGREPGNTGEPPCQPGGDCSTSAAAATRGGCGMDTALVTRCPDNPAMHGRWTTSGQGDGPWTPRQDATQGSLATLPFPCPFPPDTSPDTTQAFISSCFSPICLLYIKTFKKRLYRGHTSLR